MNPLSTEKRKWKRVELSELLSTMPIEIVFVNQTGLDLVFLKTKTGTNAYTVNVFTKEQYDNLSSTILYFD